jgi:hypothetical protein
LPEATVAAIFWKKSVPPTKAGCGLDQQVVDVVGLEGVEPTLLNDLEVADNLEVGLRGRRHDNLNRLLDDLSDRNLLLDDLGNDLGDDLGRLGGRWRCCGGRRRGWRRLARARRQDRNGCRPGEQRGSA